MIKKLKYKFILTNMILITIVLVIIFTAVYASTQQRLARDSMQALQHTINENKGGGPDRKEVIGPKKDPGNMPIATFVVNLDEKNNIINAYGALYDLSDQESLKDIVRICLANEKDSGIITAENLRYLKQRNGTWTKIAFVDRKMESSTLSSLIITSFLVGTGSLGVFFFISLFLGKWALRPVEKAWEQQKQFVADASHELRTPLTVILANTGIMLSHQESTVKDQAKWIEYIQTEATRMNTLVDNLLFLAKTDDSKNKIIPSCINLSDSVWGALLPFESIAFEQDKTLAADIMPAMYINGDESRLKHLVGILLENAFKYSDEKGTISVKVEKAERKVILSVTNTGSYIPQDQLDHIFERFFRVDKSRVREQGGYGLGLAIAESIVNMHNAQILVQSTQEAGTTFSVAFSSVSPGEGTLKTKT
jgi:signal transduction histidine kinase